MADFDSSDYLSSTSNTSYDPTVDTSKDYGSTPGASSPEFWNWISSLNSGTGTGNLLGAIGNLFSGTGFGGQLGQLAAFGGLAALLNKVAGGQSQQPVGYQGGIPTLTAYRQQTPMAQQRPAGYRPGQGGITYFTPVQYSTGAAPVSAPVQTNTDTDTDTGTKQTVPTTPSRETAAAAGGYMPSGIAMLAAGGTGGRYLRGPGDGVSDSIPAKFEKSGQPARLADGEFVIDARTVSEIGNGSSEAGARKLYAMMDRVHKARKTAQRGKPSGADKYLPK